MIFARQKTVEAGFKVDVIASEQRLDVGQRQHLLELINAQHLNDVLTGVFFAFDRQQNLFLGIVVDHGLGQEFVLRVAFVLLKTLVEQGQNLIHI